MFMVTPIGKPTKVKAKADTLRNWRRRLGHLNGPDILNLAKDPRLGIKIIGSKRLSFCEACTLAKQHKQSKKRPTRRATQRLARIFIDIAGGGETLKDPDPNKEVLTMNGFKYFVLITDDATCFRWGFLLYSKDELYDVLQIWLLHIRNLVGHEPAIIRSDIEGVLTSGRSKKLLQDYHITWEPTAAGTPEQDGPSECSNRTILERIQAMIINNGLPYEFWGEAFHAAIVMENMSSTSVQLFGCVPNTNPTTPYEAFHGCQPSARWIHRWGRPAYLWRDTNNKILARSRKLIFVGYKGTSNYRIWDPEKRKIIISPDIRFNNNDDDDDEAPIEEPIEELDEQNPPTGAPITSGAPPTNEAPSAEPAEPSGSSPKNQPPKRSKPQPPARSDRPIRTCQSAYRHPHVEEEEDLETNTNANVTWYKPAKGFKEDYHALHTTEDPDQDSESDPTDLPTNLPTDLPIPDPSTEDEVLSTDTSIPQSLAEAKRSSEWPYWYADCVREINQFKRRGTWRLVEQVPGMKVLTGKWVFDWKLNNKGETIRFKARWVVRGFMQQKGVDYNLTYAATEDCRPVATPLDPGIQIIIDNKDPGYDDEFTKEAYQSGVGSGQYLAIQTRPDIAQAAGFLARFNTKPNRQCWLA
jgi:hypothetical protein